MKLSELLNKFDEQNLRDAKLAIAWEPEEAGGLRALKKWSKETSTYQYFKFDESKSGIWRMNYREPRLGNPSAYYLSKYGEFGGEVNEPLIQFLVAEASQKPPKLPYR